MGAKEHCRSAAPSLAVGGPGVRDAYLLEHLRPLVNISACDASLFSFLTFWCLGPGTVSQPWPTAVRQEPCSEVTGRCHCGVALLTQSPAWAPRQAHWHLGGGVPTGAEPGRTTASKGRGPRPMVSVPGEPQWEAAAMAGAPRHHFRGLK